MWWRRPVFVRSSRPKSPTSRLFVRGCPPPGPRPPAGDKLLGHSCAAGGTAGDWRQVVSGGPPPTRAPPPSPIRTSVETKHISRARDIRDVARWFLHVEIRKVTVTYYIDVFGTWDPGYQVHTFTSCSVLKNHISDVYHLPVRTCVLCTKYQDTWYYFTYGELRVRLAHRPACYAK